jgi:hypothetical protein
VVNRSQYASNDACHYQRHDQGKQPMGVFGMKLHIVRLAAISKNAFAKISPKD